MSGNKVSFALTVAALALATTAGAQTRAAGGSVLWLIPAAGRLELDKLVNGALSSSDYFAPNETFLDVWELEGRAGASVTIDLKSDDFDAMLFVVGPGLAETLSDDDGGGRCDARITVRFLEDGIYRVAATVTESRATGVYTLVATGTPGPPSGASCGGPDPATFMSLPVAGRITVGGAPISSALDAADATLDNGAFSEAWELAGEQGGTVRIRLESDAFDSFLYVIGPGLDGVITDDDSGGDLHAEIVLTFPASGTYRIIASSTESRGAGAYRLTLTR